MKHDHQNNDHGIGSYPHEEGSAHSENNDVYYCPMKCEGDKTYPESGRCPVCNMKLVPYER
jgi:Cu+-exporting ATPase